MQSIPTKSVEQNRAVKTSRCQFAQTVLLVSAVQSLVGQIDHSSVVAEIGATIFRDLHGNAIGILGVALAQFLENKSQTVVPLVALIFRLARIRSTQLHEKFLT
jgi:hypothetical protein